MKFNFRPKFAFSIGFVAFQCAKGKMANHGGATQFLCWVMARFFKYKKISFECECVLHRKYLFIINLRKLCYDLTWSVRTARMVFADKRVENGKQSDVKWNNKMLKKTEVSGSNWRWRFFSAMVGMRGCVEGAFLNWHRHSHREKVYIEVLILYGVDAK